VHVRPDGAHFGCATDSAGLAELIRRLGPLAPRLIVLEASGGYEGVVLAALAEAGLPVAAVNPLQIRRFAGAIGKLAKTDTIDAAVIAHFAEAVRPEPRALPNDLTLRLRELLARRHQLVVMGQAEGQRLDKVEQRIAQRSCRTVLRALEAERKRIEAAIDKLVQSSPLWRAKENLMRTVPGVGPTVARVFIAHLPELGTLDRHKVAALAGVAPINRDSGQYRCKRRIHGGRVHLRAPLYMACLVAVRHNPPLRTFYSRLKQAGKPTRVAIVATMRKLLIILNAMLRDNTPWTEVHA